MMRRAREESGRRKAPVLTVKLDIAALALRQQFDGPSVALVCRARKPAQSLGPVRWKLEQVLAELPL